MCAKPLVILLEDDEAAADALGLVLRDWGATVVRSDDAEPALKDLPANPGANVSIITDLDLGPDRDGVTASRTLRKRLPGARVLVLSGGLTPQAAFAATAAGFDVMHKPARADAIIAWLERG